MLKKSLWLKKKTDYKFYFIIAQLETSKTGTFVIACAFLGVSGLDW